MANQRNSIDALLRVLPDGYLALDANLKIIGCNHILEQWIRQPAETILGKSLMTCFPKFEKRYYRDSFKRILDQGIPMVLSSGLHRNLIVPGEQDASPHAHRYYLTKHPDREEIIIQVTDQSKAMKSIDNYRIAMKQLDVEKKRAETANSAKSHYLAHMSHEIRTPLNGIIGYAEILQDEVEEETSLQMITALKDCSLALLDIINGVLDTSKIEAGMLELTPQPTRLQEVVDTIKDMFKVSMASHQLTFEVKTDLPDDLTVIIDRLRLQQILINLLGNAQKFTDEGSVRLRLSYDTSSATICIVVSDTGIGIKPEDLGNIFESYRQSTHLPGRLAGKGTGLGLSITKSLIELMHGEITCQSTYGAGSTFSVRIPCPPFHLEQPKADQATLALGELPDLSDKRVLVVDDNLVSTRILENHLTALNINPDTAHDPATALQKIKDASYDLVLMDINLGADIDGYEVFEQIRKLTLSYTPRVIAITANAFQHDRDYALSIGMDDFLARPVTRRRLLRTICDLLEADLAA